MTERTVPARLTSIRGAHADGEVRVRPIGDGRRTWRAGSALALCWIAALLCAFIPFFHFVLVPAFLVTGIYVARLRHEQRIAILGGRAACPDCGTALTLPGGAYGHEFGGSCLACRGRFRVVVPEPAVIANAAG